MPAVSIKRRAATPKLACSETKLRTLRKRGGSGGAKIDDTAAPVVAERRGLRAAAQEPKSDEHSGMEDHNFGEHDKQGNRRNEQVGDPVLQ